VNDNTKPSDKPRAPFGSLPPGPVLGGLGASSAGLYLAMSALASRFNWGEGYAQRPILIYLLIYFSLFALYAAACWLVIRQPLNKKRGMAVIIGFGLLFRALLFPANQIQEDDIYRYLWDGKVLAHGINPYAYAPAEVQNYLEFKISDPERFLAAYGEKEQNELERLNSLKWENRRALTVLDRVNHPDVPTIYPPLAQFVFAAVASLKADSIVAMRLAFLTFDLATLGFLVLMLGALGKNRHLCLIYFWSPLVIKETFNSTHLDIIGIALLTGSLYWLITRRHALACGFLGLSVLGKLYPAILLPLYLKEAAKPDRPPFERACHLLGLAVLFTAVVACGYLPFLDTGLKTFEGLKTFSLSWQSNDSLFAVLQYFYADVVKLQSGDQAFWPGLSPTRAAKVTVLVILLACLAWFLTRNRDDKTREQGLWPLFVMMALVFVLSPVANPWYLTWLVPFMCVFPRRAWILLTGLAGMYYLDFYFDYQDLGHLERWTPWIEYTPFYLLLAWDLKTRFNPGRRAAASGLQNIR